MAQVFDKQQAHDLIDQLPPEYLPAAVTLLKSFLPLPDDEAVTEEDRRRYQAAKALLAGGEQGTSMDDFLAEFGLVSDSISVRR